MKEFISFETYANDAIKLADMIKKTGRTFKSIIVITRGGLFPATILSAQLNIKKIDTFCLASYSNKVGGEIQELKKPVIDLKDALFVDDLSDSGNTARYVKHVYPDAFFACVYVKEHGKDYPDLTYMLKNFLRTHGLFSLGKLISNSFKYFLLSAYLLNFNFLPKCRTGVLML